MAKPTRLTHNGPRLAPRRSVLATCSW